MRAFPLNDTVVGTPSAGPRFAGPALQPHGVVVELFADEACTVPLAAQDALGAPISSVVIDGVTLPRFTVADDAVTTVYGRAQGETGPGFPLFAHPRDGVDGQDGAASAEFLAGVEAAETARAEAAAAAVAAAGSASTAGFRAVEAGEAAALAAGAQTAAEAARSDSVAAAGSAETARSAAEGFADLARQGAVSVWDDVTATYSPRPALARVLFIGPTSPHDLGLMQVGDVWMNTDPDAAIPTDPPRELRGNGSPEGAVVAAIGVRFVDLSATLGASVWRKATGTGSTGWKAVEGDTGPRILTPEAGWSSVAGTAFGPTVHRVGNMVDLQFYLSTADYATASGTVLLLASGFRPRRRRLVLGARVDTGAARYFEVTTTGGVLIPAGTGTASIMLSATFPTDDPWPTSLPGVAG
jgi:hypothetical protein